MTYNGTTVGVVVPAYNEAGFVGDVIETVPAFVDRVYVIDDDSTDGTWQEIQAVAERVNRTTVRGERTDGGATSESGRADGGATSDRVVPIRHDRNRGVGAAIKTGYRRAYEDGIGVTAVMAGDGQMDPDLLDDLLNPIVNGQAEYAKGNRLLSPEFREGMPPFRLFGNGLLTLLTKIASGYWHTGDPQNGYTAISYDALDSIDIDSLYGDYGFANELLVRLNRQEMRVADVAVPAIYGDEQSTIEYRTFVPTLSMLLLENFLRRLWTETVEFGNYATVLCYVICSLCLLSVVPAGVVFGPGGSAVASGLGGVALAFAASLDAANHEHLETRILDTVD